jgi:transcriptional regulator with XRE-family HTH domain
MSATAIRKLAERPRLPDPADARRACESRGVLVSELAAALDVHPVTASKWLNGRQRPTGKRARAYAELIAALLQNDESPDGSRGSRSQRTARDGRRNVSSA